MSSRNNVNEYIYLYLWMDRFIDDYYGQQFENKYIYEYDFYDFEGNRLEYPILSGISTINHNRR